MSMEEPLLAGVTHVEEVDPNVIVGGRSNNVNDYLSIGWILLNTGTNAATGDSGPYSWVYYSLGWVGHGSPTFPPPEGYLR